QLLEMPIGAASPETVTAIFGQGAYFANTEVLLAASALDAYSQVFFVLLLFIIARTICSSRMAAFAIAVIVSAETLVWTRTLIVLGTTSFLETGDFPAGLASVAIAILLAFIICDIIKPNVSERSFPMHMLKVDNVSKRIKKQTILKNVNLEFESGRCYELKGANGSGKTMLIKIIAGLVKPTQGLVSVDDKTLGRDVEFLPNTGVLIESPSFIEDRTGLRNLELLASIRGTASEHSLRAIMETVGLDPDLKTLYRKYSLGMKQRLGIAAAIMEDPEIILLDEPLNALDEKGVFMVKRVIEQCKKTNALVIVSNHSNDLLDDVIDASVIFENGTATMRVNSGERP
ncbi:MAG: ABC transporter ATP-binding protein, partial [Slackia sp.]|nr:ABC transporter ATP-binding protein [Slackia sp.]